jgi:DUF3072 family protein
MENTRNNQSNESQQEGSGAQQRHNGRGDNAQQDGAVQQEFSGMNQSQSAPPGKRQSAGAEQGQAPGGQAATEQEQRQSDGGKNESQFARNLSNNDQPGSDAQGNTGGANNQGNTIKDPADWVTGDQPMTGAQNSYLHTLAAEAGEQVSPELTKAEAAIKIEELQQKTGRGVSNGTEGE